MQRIDVQLGAFHQFAGRMNKLFSTDHKVFIRVGLANKWVLVFRRAMSMSLSHLRELRSHGCVSPMYIFFACCMLLFPCFAVVFVVCRNCYTVFKLIELEHKPLYCLKPAHTRTHTHPHTHTLASRTRAGITKRFMTAQRIGRHENRRLCECPLLNCTIIFA